METKICTGCKEDKPFIEFTKAKLGKYGLRSKCRSCRAAEAVEFNSTRKDAISAHGKSYRNKNKERISVQRAVHTEEHKEEIAAYGSVWRRANPGKVNARTAKRRAAKLQRTPKWLTKEQLKEMEKFYIEAARLTKETGIPHEVDHIEPLQGKEVSGLHVPWNLRVVPVSINRHKSNKRI
jgi:hypothetical protein